MGGPEILCGVVLWGLTAVLFCLALAVSAYQGRGAIGLFIFGALLCCFLLAVISAIFLS